MGCRGAGVGLTFVLKINMKFSVISIMCRRLVACVLADVNSSPFF